MKINILMVVIVKKTHNGLIKWRNASKVVKYHLNGEQLEYSI